jgi:hypothetical protein
MGFFDNNKNDVVVMMFSFLAVLIAGTLSMATILNRDSHPEPEFWVSENPYDQADAAATAGLTAAQWHLQCHGRQSKGGFQTKYYLNGAQYQAKWDDVDMADSTVIIRSVGIAKTPDGQEYRVEMNSKIKLNFIPAHKSDIMAEYYSRN